MTTLILVRHGESEANDKKIFAGSFNPPLTSLGKKQAEATAKYLKENYSIDKVYASDLKRAYCTGLAIAEKCGVPVIKDKNLREIYAGEWEGKLFTDIENTYADDYKIWRQDTGNARCTGGESVRELSERIYNFLQKIAKQNDGKTIAVATHATPIRAMHSLVQFSNLDEMKNIRWVTNASVSILIFDSEKFELVEKCYDAHLEELKSYLPPNV